MGSSGVTPRVCVMTSQQVSHFMSFLRTDSPKPTNTYTLNPLKCFLSSFQISTENKLPNQTQSFFAPDSLAIATIHRINDHISKLKSSTDLSRCADYTTLLYSPLFLCFTALPFYAALLIELKLFARALDVGKILNSSFFGSCECVQKIVFHCFC